MARKTYKVNADMWTDLMDLLILPCEDFNSDKSTIRGRAHQSRFTADTGRLPEAIAIAFKDAAHAGRIEYVIYSYETPIAWLEWTGHALPNEVLGSNGKRVGYSPRRWVIPNHKYSVTTSKHQGKVRTAISQISEACI